MKLNINIYLFTFLSMVRYSNSPIESWGGEYESVI